MPRFSKLFPNLTRVFPGQGEVLAPQEVSNDVSLVHDLLKCDVKHQLYLTTLSQTVNSGAGGNVLLSGPEPAANYIHIFLSAALFNPEAALQRLVRTLVEQTGSVLGDKDISTGLWGDGAGDTTVRDQMARPSTWTDVGVPFPIVRGTRPRFLMLSVGAALDVQLRTFSLQLPVETIDWSRFIGAGEFRWSRETTA